MSEEMIKNLIARLNHNCSNACLNEASSCICTVNDIKDLIHLYNKEKEKNKELQKYKTYYEEMEEVNKKFIPKSKVKEKIKEYNIPIFDVLDKLPIPRTIERGCGAKDGIIYVLQELLEEGE